MELAVDGAGVGYYARGARKLGAGGDFVTAPELGSLFGRTLARELRPFDRILEIGAGSGALADVLADGREYLILETSADLIRRQKEKLGDRVQHVQQLPAGFHGAVIANEVVDALPAHVVHWTDGGILERGVATGLQWADRPATGELLDAARSIAQSTNLPLPYLSEIGLQARAWMRTVVEALAQGAVFVLDYGFPRHEYYHPQRATGTLMCHYRHQPHADPFARPGEADVTTQLAFSSLPGAAP